MSSSVVLNSDFKVIESSSGPIYGPTGVSSILHVDVETEECFTSGPQGSDVLLEYTGLNGGFTLDTLVFHPSGHMDSRAASVAIWVYESKPDMASYSGNYDNITPHSFMTGNGSATGPMPTSVVALKKNAPTCVKLASVSGKYIHIKYLTNHVHSGNVFFSAFFLVGYADVRGTLSNPTVNTTDAAKPVIDFNAIRNMTTQYIDETERQHLIQLNCLPPVLQTDGLNRIHPAFVNYLNDNPCVFLVTNHNVEEAKKNTESPIHEIVAACSMAAKYAGYASITYFYIDPTIEYTILKSCLNYLRIKVPRENEEVVFSLPNPKSSYEIFTALPTLVSCMSAQREGYITESLRLIHNQVTIGLRYRGVAKRGSFVKQQFLAAVEGGLSNAKGITELMSKLSLDKTSTLKISAQTEALAKKVHLFSQLFCLHDRTESTEIVPFVPCEQHYYNNELPFYAGVKVATTTTFRTLVLDHKQPVLVYYKAGVIASHIEADCIIFQMLLEKLGCNLQVVLFDPLLNEFEDISEPTDKDGVIRLFLKGISYNAVSGQAVVQKALEGGGGHITVVDYPVYNQGLAHVIDAEVAGKKITEDELDLHSEAVFLPSFETLINFLKFYTINIPVNMKDATADLEKKRLISNFNSAYLARYLGATVTERVASLLTNEGIGQGLLYRFKSAEAEAKDARLLTGMSAQVHNIFNAIHAPIGDFIAPTAQHQEATKFTEVYEELAALVIDAESAIANLEKAVTVLKQAQSVYSTCSNLLHNFKIFKEDEVAILTSMYNKFEAVLGPLPVLNSTVDIHEYKLSLKKQSSQHYDLNIPQLTELTKEMTAFYTQHKEKISVEAKLRFTESKFTENAIFLENYEDLERALNGHELNNVTGAKFTPFDPQYSTVCVFIDNNFCANLDVYAALMAGMSDPLYAEVNFYPIVPIYVNINHFDNPEALKTLFNTNTLPAVRFLHNMDILEDISIDAATPDAVFGAVQHVLTVFPLLNSDDDTPLEDEEDMYEDGYDMSDMGNFNF